MKVKVKTRKLFFFYRCQHQLCYFVAISDELLGNIQGRWSGAKWGWWRSITNMV